MNSKIFEKTLPDGFRVSWLNDGNDWLGIFEKLRAALAGGNGGADAWKLLQRGGTEGKFLRRTWRVKSEMGGQEYMIFKHEKIFRSWNLDRVLRAFRSRASALQARIERARSAGFAFPMRIFLTAERYEAGMLRERFLICEYVDGKNAGRSAARDREVVAAVRRAHEFGLCWGGDPDPCGGNILADADGNLRGVDISPFRATWRMRGKDLNFFCEAGMLTGALPLSVRVARLQARIKDIFRN